jgi:ribose 5-phosphate isomerase
MYRRHQCRVLLCCTATTSTSHEKKESVTEPFTEAIVITPNFNYVLHGKQMAHNKSEKHHQQLVHLEGVLPNALQNRKEDGHCSILPDVL